MFKEDFDKLHNRDHYTMNFNNHDHFSLGLGGRYKITNRVSINFENFIQLEKSANRNVLAFGFDIETGGHVFQLHLSNSSLLFGLDLYILHSHILLFYFLLEYPEYFVLRLPNKMTVPFYSSRQFHSEVVEEL